MFWLEAVRKLASGLEASNSEFKAAVSHVQLRKKPVGDQPVFTLSAKCAC